MGGEEIAHSITRSPAHNSTAGRAWGPADNDDHHRDRQNADFEATFKRESKDGQKLSLMSIITSIALGVGVAMLALNYYHASTCIANSPDEKEAFIKAIGHRLESVERSVSHNTAHLDKLVEGLQTHLLRIPQPCFSGPGLLVRRGDSTTK